MSNAIITSITRNANKFIFKAREHSPEILSVVGVIGTITAAVLACRATTKVEDVLDEAQHDIDEIHETEYEDNTEETKELAHVYVRTGIDVVKLYAPAIGLGVLSLGCMLMSTNILRKRNVAIAAAYATVDKAFKDYRGRVIERFGDEVDKELRYNLSTEKITETEVDPETGEERKVKKTAHVINGNELSDYARFFDDTSRYWVNDSSKNLTFLKAQQRFANEHLIRHGHMFLNEVYDMLGIPRTKAGQRVGWIYDPEKNVEGDNYIDFGIYSVDRAQARDFVNGYESVIIIDPNVDGIISEKFENYIF